ncbi:SDR family NAD(P)-dependent oxidoreductase [Amycolatopsis kentuckyensis]|uniref:SDR family NAD(P)-dependent oxidoreductase n=1 Tax=Amycolatopsis kentuckyensis TaxID=218823 RepID=UPI000A36FAF7|nr:SDR family NAD(P)-dependent oxidoreductase [Amycolatopsis kentuckyensis]
MKTLVIAGGTDGIGRHLTETHVRRGDHVVVVGRDEVKGKAVVSAADGPGRAEFARADLSLLAETRALVTDLADRLPAIDALVLCARHYRSTRTVTREGIEENFALFYLSRFLLGHGLRSTLEAAPVPVIVNVAGPGGDLSLVRWDDLQLRRGYHGGLALGQGGKLNDLLGVSFAEQYAGGATRYVLVHPGVTATGFSGTYDRETLAHIDHMKRHAKPVRAAAEPISRLIEAPPAAPLSAFVEGEPLGVTGRGFAPASARRLDVLTRELLSVTRIDLP